MDQEGPGQQSGKGTSENNSGPVRQKQERGNPSTEDASNWRGRGRGGRREGFTKELTLNPEG